MFKFILIVLDGFGLRPEVRGNAYRMAHAPTLETLLTRYPMIPLETSGEAVGLPAGTMGNSEVGHMNIGAGRIVRQDLVRINKDIETGTFARNPVLLEHLHFCRDNGRALHVMGLCSDGGVHSHLNHLYAILEAAHEAGLRDVYFHAFMDGRDTSPKAGKRYLAEIGERMEELNLGQIATIIGRYYAMDRDKRWDRIARAYRMLVHGDGEFFQTPDEAIEASYAAGTGDEFVTPRIIRGTPTIRKGDGLLAMNFRADRMRQISSAFTTRPFSPFPVEDLSLHYGSMTSYGDTFRFPVLYPPESLDRSLPEILAGNGYRQLRAAETEKYAHVTYFLNGGDERSFEGEKRILIPSPKVATYDLQPAMSAVAVTDKVIEAIESGEFEAIFLNYANPDMVGHTGIMSAAVQAVEAVDRCLGRVFETAMQAGGALFLTADHGNVEQMIDPETGDPHTAHTTNPVPFVLAVNGNGLSLEGRGKLADIAPTILDYLDLPIPVEMTGKSRLVRVGEPAH